MDITRDITKRVQETITAHGMLDRDDRVVVAVSGGADSVCLLHILRTLCDKFSIDLVVAHYDHGLRPEEDEDETRFVRRLALSMKVPFESAKWASSEGHGASSPEERARDARYAFFEDIRIRHRAQKVALGHNLNDQAETVLMRLLRGSGPSGLAGIPPVRDGRLIRPLLNLKREDIISYLDFLNLPYVTDSSNLQAEFLRNEIRLEWMPRLLRMQPKLLEHLGHLAGVLREENHYMEHQAREWVRKTAETLSEDEVAVPVTPFLELPVALRNRVIRTILGKVKKDLRRIDRGHLRAVYDLTAGEKPQGRLTLPQGLSVERTYDTLRVSRMPRGTPPSYLYALEGPGKTFIEETGRAVTISRLQGRPGRMRDDSPKTAYLNGDKLHFPLTLRNFKAGDRFIPLGMSGHMKVKDFFINLKIPLQERAATPILFHGDRPVWICGLRIDDRFKVTKDTKKILKATFS